MSFTVAISHFMFTKTAHFISYNLSGKVKVLNIAGTSHPSSAHAVTMYDLLLIMERCGEKIRRSRKHAKNQRGSRHRAAPDDETGSGNLHITAWLYCSVFRAWSLPSQGQSAQGLLACG